MGLHGGASGDWTGVLPFFEEDATGGRRLRMDARLPVLRLIRVGRSPRLRAAFRSLTSAWQALGRKRRHVRYPLDNECEAEGRGWW